MPHRWKETGGSWEPDHTLLSDEQLAKCTRAYDADADCPSPVPTRVVSNGEYLPPPQSETQKKVEARINELTETRRPGPASRATYSFAFLNKLCPNNRDEPGQ